MLAVPPPPIPKVAAPYGVRVVDPDSSDTELIAHWMRQPRLVAAWEQDWPTERWYRHLKAQVEGTYSRPVIGTFRGRPGGYFEFYRSAQDSIATVYDADPYDIGLHVAAAEDDLVGRGLGPRLLPRVVASLFELEPECKRLMVDPDHRNTEARKICEYAGFAFLGEHQMPNRRMALYALPRTPAEVPRLRGSCDIPRRE
ncbi:GNAT family N-acetyltransferase [Nocardia sp. 2TAF39]|uniref:GNAT family N-acetyltransferase n=1 Tax=unclassified Nocardia TaxID=2637762 RepID=UPI003F95FBE2